MFYHVIVETKENGKQKSEKYSVFDVQNIDDIIEHYGLPYISGDEFIIDGYTISKNSIKRFYVSETDKNAQQLVSDFRDSMRNSGVFLGISREMMVNDDHYARDVTGTVLGKAKDLTPAKINTFSKEKVNDNCKNVFIVHGREDGLKNEVARFIEKIGLNAIILHEQASSSMTVIEKLEKHTDVCFAVILYTACDIGSIKEPLVYKPRARQNVVFEHGYLIGKLSRKNVCALVEESVELPSDIAGIVFTQHDKNGMWKYTIAKEMKAAGINIDLNKI